MAKKSNHLHILLRYVLISCAILLFSGAICYKLFSTTIVNAHHWNNAAARQLQRTDTIAPQRGDILSDKGQILATNLRYYTLRLDFRSDNFKQQAYLSSLPALADSMAAYFPHRTAAEWADYLGKPLEKPRLKRPRAYPLLSNISYLDLQRVKKFPFFEIGNPNKTGLTVETVMRRTNPYGKMAKRSVGAVGQTAECREVHGIYGLEKALDSLLYGTPGLARKIPLTHDIVSWVDTRPIPGYNIRTTIDIQLQEIVENELNRVLDSCSADWGCAVLMEVATGDIKAISNLERSQSGKYIEALNYAMVGFEPGSVVKPISMMIALEDGLVNNLEEVIPIGKSWAYGGGRPITDSHYNGSLRVREVIEQSSNIGMAKIIARGYDKNPPAFVERLRSIGFLEPLNTGIAGETTPWFNPQPKRIDLSRMCFGYSSKIPPIYTLAIYNAIANNGKFVRPRLIKALGLPEQGDSILDVTYVRDRICSEENARKMQYMLSQVVAGSHGTGRSLRNDRVSLAGKTGTCYSVDPATRQYNRGIKRLAFCGFFPAEQPRYSCIVLTFHPRRNMMGAASTSGQVMKNIALKMYSRGMLNNTSDYAATPAQQTRPQMYASLLTGRHAAACKAVGSSSETHPAAPRPTPEGTVPSVVGLSLREAVANIENKGYSTSHRGVGYVVAQNPPAGTPHPKNKPIQLILTQ